MRFVIFEVNADRLKNQLAKYFYTRHLTLFLNGIIKFALSIAKSFKNIHYENICELFKSDSFPLKKILTQT